MIDQKLFCNTYFDLQETKNDQAKGTNRKKLVPCFFANLTSTQPEQKLNPDFSASCVEVILDFDTTCVEVGFLTSAQVGQKLDFGLPNNLVGSLFFIPDKLSGS